MQFPNSVLDRLQKCYSIDEMADVLWPLSGNVLQTVYDSLMAEYARITDIAKAIENEKQMRAAGTVRPPRGLEKFLIENAFKGDGR